MQYRLSSGLVIAAPEIGCRLSDEGELYYLQASGATSWHWAGECVQGHGVDRHPEGFGSPIGMPESLPWCDWEQLSDADLARSGIQVGARVEWCYPSGVTLHGEVAGWLRCDSVLIAITLVDCTVKGPAGETLFDPAWGEFDLALMTDCEPLS